MLFNSTEFIFIFLPIAFAGYFLLATATHTILPKIWLVACSLFFYSFWNHGYLALIFISMSINFILGHFLILHKRKALITIGIIFNLGLLGYYKYLDFMVANINFLFSTELPLLNIILPLAISFFTFQQVSYLVDCYKGKIDKYSFVDYILFITFFPQLIAGPIVYHHEIMPQFYRSNRIKINVDNISLGIFIFAIGLFKKVILADNLSLTVSDGMHHLDSITFFDAWTVILSYTFQLYFDFSGYSDMAIGIALLFNIKLPINFNSPYKSTNFQDLASRWHITLSRFLNDYVFNPMSRLLSKTIYSNLPIKLSTNIKTSFNLILLFLLSGIWHGAGWNYIIWGLLFGTGIVSYRTWKKNKLNIKLPTILSWGITFIYINIMLVFFRLEEVNQAVLLLKAMFGLNGFILPEQLSPLLNFFTAFGFSFEATPLKDKYRAIGLIIISFIIVLGFKNSSEKLDTFKPTLLNALFIVVLLIYSIISLTKATEFLYFNF
ncbi:MBOAT family protein [Paenibacillus sp. GSMTC-2017]|uniref:MBOAT family O-acyltransferase n=1 Tax=Paenibacillus sp. GSMTC-2017 TaxID=2794350 RepID=UPI0018D7A514|nr:MBOAT family protein [Paenibacillus sp. GSMTC-2017]